MRVLSLDRDIDWRELKLANGYVTVDGKKYEVIPNSVKSWITIISTESFEGKTVELCATESHR